MGDWKIYGNKKRGIPPSKHPTLSTYRYTFTPDELCKHWEWLKGRRDQFQKILDSQVLLPKILAIPSGQTWECEKCSYNGAPCPHGGKEEEKC